MSARYPHDDEVCRQNSIDAASFPDLCRQVASLQAEWDELRAEMARLRGPFPCCPHCAGDDIHDIEPNEHELPCTICDAAARLREALAGDQP